MGLFLKNSSSFGMQMRLGQGGAEEFFGVNFCKQFGLGVVAHFIGAGVFVGVGAFSGDPAFFAVILVADLEALLELGVLTQEVGENFEGDRGGEVVADLLLEAVVFCRVHAHFIVDAVNNAGVVHDHRDLLVAQRALCFVRQLGAVEPHVFW